MATSSGESSGEQLYIAGYNAGRTACLQAGSSDPARLWIEERPRLDPAYIAGYEWALWDYDDANGVRRIGGLEAGSARASTSG